MLRLVLSRNSTPAEMIEEADRRIDEYPTNPQISIRLELPASADSSVDAQILDKFRIKGWNVQNIVRIDIDRYLMFNRNRL